VKLGEAAVMFEASDFCLAQIQKLLLVELVEAVRMRLVEESRFVEGTAEVFGELA
jgi:hypothetical protein